MEIQQRFKIINLRVSVFSSQNILYSPQIAQKLKGSLYPNANILPAIPQDKPFFMGPTMAPQWGMPWTLAWEKDEESWNIGFLPGKIDIICQGSINYKDQVSEEFVAKCIDWIDKIGKDTPVDKISRIAFAPTLILRLDGKDDDRSKKIWEGLLSPKINQLSDNQDKNIRFNYHSKMTLNNEPIIINRLINISEGFEIVQKDNNAINTPVIFFELDINTPQDTKPKYTISDVQLTLNKFVEYQKELINDFIAL